MRRVRAVRERTRAKETGISRGSLSREKTANGTFSHGSACQTHLIRRRNGLKGRGVTQKRAPQRKRK